MGDREVGTVESRSGRLYRVKWNDWGEVYVQEVSGGIVGAWDGPSGKADSPQEALDMAENFVSGK